MIQKISVVLLTYKRPENCQKIIQTYETYKIIDEILVASNGEFLAVCDLKKTNVFDLDNSLGCFARYYVAQKAQNEIIFLSDDDFLLSEKDLESLVKYYNNTPEVIHGYFGRKLRGDIFYAKYIDGIESQFDIVLPGLSFVSKNNIEAFWDFYQHTSFFSFIKLINNFLRIVWFNGEDIAFAYFCSKKAKAKNYTHSINPCFLDDVNAISKKNNKRYVLARTIIVWYFKFFSWRK